MSVSAHKLFKGGISIPYIPLVLLDIRHIDFQSQEFKELVSMVQVPRVAMPNVGNKPLIQEGGVS